MTRSVPPAPVSVQFQPWKYLGMVAMLFAALVGGWTWFLLSRGSEGREYARAALAASAGRTVPAAGLPCADVLGRPLPSSVTACVVRPGTPLTAELELQGGRKGVLRGE